MSERSKSLHPSRSFTRLEPAPKSPLSRSRASTLQGPPVPDMLDPLKANMVVEEDENDDESVFAKKEEDEEAAGEEPHIPDTFEELPIEIRSLTERYGVASCTYLRPCLTRNIDFLTPSRPKYTRLRSLLMPSPTSSRTSTVVHRPRSTHI